MPRDDSLDGPMLTLAAITYRGFALPGATSPILRREMTGLIGRLAPVKNHWSVVWGPASFRAGLNAFDDAAMFVAQNRQHTSQVVIAVRGTNPVSVFDWLLGDLMVARQVPWSYGRPGDVADARISFSTALGLSILQRLRWDPGDGSATEQTQDSAASPLPPLLANLRQTLRDLRGQLTASLRAAGAATNAASNQPFATRVETLLQLQSSPEAARGLQAFDDAVGHLAGARLDPLRLVLGGTMLQQAFERGVTLQEFLKNLLARATDPVDVYVTGHSKGGALCTALATWLADTQGREPVAVAEPWDPDRNATVHAYGFAGPTPGNGAFARHVDAVLDGRCHRIANHLDLVPYAWSTRDLGAVADLYPVSPLEQTILHDLTAQLIRRVKHLDYQHAGADSIALPGIPRPGKPLGDQIVHQHLDGYFEQLKLDGEMGTPTFFGPF